MRIAQVAPLHEPVPPPLYGGTERVVSILVEELIDLGHDVTLFASGDSTTRARLVSGSPRALRLDPDCYDRVMYHVLQNEQVMRLWREFDFIHFHTDYFTLPLARRSPVPSLTTLHGRLDLPDLVPIYREFTDVALVSISNAQRAPLPHVNWRGTVYHGIRTDIYRLGRGDGGYLAFLGRISLEKRLDRAIEIARRVGLPLKVAAKVDAADRTYFEEIIRPLLDHPLVDFIGEIADPEKVDFLGQAKALLFPIDWPEPFGLAMIEAMACGTPVLAFRCGSVPEIVDDGLTGVVVASLDEAVAAIGRLLAMDRAACRQRCVERFDARRMADDYLALYRGLMTRALRPVLGSAA